VMVILDRELLAGGEAKERLVDHCSGGEGLSGAEAPALTVCDAAQLLVDRGVGAGESAGLSPARRRELLGKRLPCHVSASYHPDRAGANDGPISRAGVRKP
jgi:hypothetical protein